MVITTNSRMKEASRSIRQAPVSGMKGWVWTLDLGGIWRCRTRSCHSRLLLQHGIRSAKQLYEQKDETKDRQDRNDYICRTMSPGSYSHRYLSTASMICAKHG